VEGTWWNGGFMWRVEGVEPTKSFGFQIFYPNIPTLHTLHTLHSIMKSNKNKKVMAVNVAQNCNVPVEIR
jgi:hypothetical protein